MRTAFLVAVALAVDISHLAYAQRESVSHAAGFSVTYIGQQIVPGDMRFKGTVVGGLSSIDYNPRTGHYLVVSDDRSKKNPARFYELSLDLAKFRRSEAPGMSGVTFHSFTVIQRPGGEPFKKNSIDPEGLRFDTARNKIYWSSEGRRGLFSSDNPTVSEMNPDGSYSRSFTVPSYYFPRGSELGILPGNTGIYNNLGFESLAISPDGETLYTATENGLIQDSPPATAFSGSRARILAFDISSGRSSEEYIYEVEPVIETPPLLRPFAINGLTDFVATGNRQFITVERSFTAEAVIPGGSTGYKIRLFYADARGANNVSAMESIAGRGIVPVRKWLLLDLSDLKNADGSALSVGNIEGITFGPDFNGRHTLILVADNNFSTFQLTQFIALELNPIRGN
ncbi:MAG TPA: esterase-like activity of phytase family protein [Nitrosospira sp.]|nr:esterase-like activity of phytase family protein [Nitrosospira sp.]